MIPQTPARQSPPRQSPPRQIHPCQSPPRQSPHRLLTQVSMRLVIFFPPHLR